jgi:chemotaxis protein MotB
MFGQQTVEEDTLLWSLADLMTLLLIFFILFYSQNLNKTFSPTIGVQTGKPIRQEEKPSLSQDLPAAAPSPALQRARVPQLADHQESEKPDASLEQLRREVLSTLDEGEDRAFSVRWDHRRLVLVLGEQIVFRLGEAELLDKFLPTLRQITGFIAAKEGYQVVVSGHTDDTPISNPRFPSNWELSAIRAVNVAKFLIANRVDPQRVHVQGYSEYRPLFENTLSEYKQANRRVEITLVKEQN